MQGSLIEKCTANQRNITWRLYLESASRLRASLVILKGSLRPQWGHDREGDDDEEESGEVQALSYVFTHAAESGRGASPPRVLTPGNALVVVKKKKKRRGSISASRRAHTGAQRRGGNVATMCDARGERVEVSFSALLRRYGAHVHAPTSPAPLPPRPRSMYTYVRARGMRGNRRLLSSGNLAPGKLRHDDGSPHPVRVHGHAQRQNFCILASAKCYRDERSGAVIFCS